MRHIPTKLHVATLVMHWGGVGEWVSLHPVYSLYAGCFVEPKARRMAGWVPHLTRIKFSAEGEAALLPRVQPAGAQPHTSVTTHSAPQPHARMQENTRVCTYRTFTNANGCELCEYCVNECEHCEQAHPHRANSVTGAWTGVQTGANLV